VFDELITFSFQLSILPFLVTLIYCFMQKQVTIRIYIYILALMLLNITILYIVGTTVFFVGKWAAVDTRALEPILFIITQLFFSPIAVIYILKKYFSCQATLAYILFIIFNLSLFGYVFSVIGILSIHTALFLGHPL